MSSPSRRPLWTVVLLLLLGAVALWSSAALEWDASAHRSGGAVEPALVPVAWLAVAAVAATVALGGWVRRVLGVVVALAGGTTVYLAVADAGGLLGRGVGGLGGVLVLAAGLALVVRGSALPRLGGGYQTPGAAKRVVDPERELWNALERGDDPTARDRPHADG
ncbi:Trp biosynthesis-associated membrane protein [Actinosynnema sp. NPDC020468]|uniref:Trp biosynthesis-associated membrane protein n=1 Tax=Actinosynnema sp. NPDC020468 TaxID=3154488 RepID=UPI0033C18EFB